MAVPPRKFTLFDAMILIAATAGGLAIERATRWDLHKRLNASIGLASDILTVVHYIQAKLVPFLLTCTIAVLWLRLLPPRPSLRRLAIEPGVVACGGATLAIGILLVWQGPYVAFMPRGIGPRLPYLYVHAPYVSFAVVGAWFHQLLSRRWRPEPTWLDRLGRLLGFLWIGAFILANAATYALLALNL